MKREFNFYNAEPLISFIAQHKDRITGQRIRNFYSSAPFGEWSETPVAFELDDYSVVIDYLCYSDMTLYIVESQELKNDLSLNFLYRDVPESRNVRLWVKNVDFPFIGDAISDIHVKRFSHEFEINPSTGETRPNGGDYFSVITVFLSSGQEFCVCAVDSFFDGYIQVW